MQVPNSQPYPNVTPFYLDTERTAGGRLGYIDRSDYAWNAESDASETSDSNAEMAFHSVAVGLAGFGVMKLFGQNTATASYHSLMLAGLAFLYMGLFGHGLPDNFRGPLAQSLRGDE